MPLSKPIKKAIYIFIAFFVLFSFLVILRNWNTPVQATDDKKEAIAFITENEKPGTLPKKWKYNLGSSMQWVSTSCNDSSWKSINPELDVDSVPAQLFDSIICFRCYFSVDSSLVNKILTFNITHYGASEIYLDGRIIQKYGEVSDQAAIEKGSIPSFPAAFTLPDTNEHLLAVRYSNHQVMEYYRKYNEYLGGMEIKFVPDLQAAYMQKKENNATIFVVLWLFAFFFTLSVVHFLLYIFYRRQKQNLYYSLFVVIFSLVVLKPYLTSWVHVPYVYLFYEYYSIMPALLLLPSLVGCLYSLFKPDHAKILFIIGSVITVSTTITFYYPPLQDYNGIFFFALIIFTCIESIRCVITGISRKQEGAKIIGTGVSVFFVFIVSAILTAFVTQSNVAIQINGIKGLFIFLLLILAIISIPLSMSIYLARNFAFTNRHLNDKLIEVEELSAKTLLQEKEKQQILALQNEILEQQVKERTAEVVLQKQLIEEKHKEITDSIRYASRIQRALISNEKYIEKILSKLKRN